VRKLLDDDLMAECIRDEEAHDRGEITAMEEYSRNMGRAAMQYRREIARGEDPGVMPKEYEGLASIAFALADARQNESGGE
jgi:hypothetical protein